jgi:hypothetical protein
VYTHVKNNPQGKPQISIKTAERALLSQVQNLSLYCKMLIMKKQNIILVALIALCACMLPTLTQAQTEKVWSFGPEVGITISSYGNDGASSEAKPGLGAGVFLTYSIINTFGITTKLLYYEKGAEFSSMNTKQTLQYVEIPVIGRFFLNSEGNVRPNIFFGPSFAFLTGAKDKVGGDVEKLENFENSFNTFDFGLTGGLGCSFRIRNETYFVLDGRYTHGISDISKGNEDVNNKSFAVSAGLQFGIGDPRR